MHSRRHVEVNDESLFPVDLEFDHDGTPLGIDLDASKNRRSWRKSCAAKRSIERFREEQHLKALLADTFDDDDAMQYADLDED